MVTGRLICCIYSFVHYRQQLSLVYDEIRQVDPLDSQDEAHLALLTRPELGITFSKIHCWRLTQYNKCVFLDADTLVSTIRQKKRRKSFLCLSSTACIY